MKIIITEKIKEFLDSMKDKEFIPQSVIPKEILEEVEAQQRIVMEEVDKVVKVLKKKMKKSAKRKNKKKRKN
jgi:hypothetical protein